MAKFKIGDIIVLKSGGPAMTVDHITPNGEIGAVWFNGKKREIAWFTENSIEHMGKLIEHPAKASR